MFDNFLSFRITQNYNVIIFSTNHTCKSFHLTIKTATRQEDKYCTFHSEIISISPKRLNLLKDVESIYKKKDSL